MNLQHITNHWQGVCQKRNYESSAFARKLFGQCLIVTLLFLGGVQCIRADQEPVPYLTTWGAWPICKAGLAPSPVMDCTWYTPNTGVEEYALMIPNTSAGVVAYSWTVTVVLENGESKTLAGVVQRAASGEVTSVPVLKFGGVVQSASVQVEVQGLVPVGLVRARGGVRVGGRGR